MKTDEPELIIKEDFLENSHLLFDRLMQTVTWDERMYAIKTASFGVPYNYSGISYDAIPMHEELLFIVDRIDITFGFRPNNCLLNYYENGDRTMGFHADEIDRLVSNTGIIIVSLGATRTIAFQSKNNKCDRYNYPLKSGSLLFMSQEIQNTWQHAILKQTNTEARISLTFRDLLQVA
jgi:alkylated DNA repair dioxygenase AlkB